MMQRAAPIRIDVHHHFFPKSLDKKSQNLSVGWRTPTENLPWSPEITLKAMDELGIHVAILSHPPLSLGSPGPVNRAWARENNLLAAKLCEEYPNRFGFFGTLPILDDVEGALQEIEYVFDELNADGIALPSSYGEGADAKYIGHDLYTPVWEELDRRHAVVFLHGAQTPSSTQHPHDFLGVPIVEVPNETFKAAAHLVVTLKKRTYPNVKIILAHAGGSTPLLAARVAVLSRHMGCMLSPEEILADFKTFYYEVALSGYETNLAALEKFVVEPDRLLFGTDFPAVNKEMSMWFTRNVDDYCGDDADKLGRIMYRNAQRLFPRLQKKLCTANSGVSTTSDRH